MPEEVRMSWSPKYILLAIVVSIPSVLVGIFLKAYFEPHENRVLTLIESTSSNLISLDPRAQSGIIASYTLKDQPNQQLKSYFEHRVGLKNVGNIDADMIRVVVDVDEPKVKLIGPPSFTVSPPEQQGAVAITSEANLQNNNKNDWIISLLKPNETIEMVFIAYSTDSPDKPKFSATVRKKDWEIISSTETPKQQSQILIGDIFKYMAMPLIVSIYIAMFMYLMFRRRLRREFDGNDIRHLSDYEKMRLLKFLQRNIHTHKDNT